ncbi:MAG: hypothetical protein ACI4JM_11385 [Oscillospiraceae bacterium]
MVDECHRSIYNIWSQVPIISDSIAKCTINTINARLSNCERIEETIDTALQQAKALRQSILKKAFEGEL